MEYTEMCDKCGTKLDQLKWEDIYIEEESKVLCVPCYDQEQKIEKMVKDIQMTVQFNKGALLPNTFYELTKEEKQEVIRRFRARRERQNEEKATTRCHHADKEKRSISGG